MSLLLGAEWTLKCPNPSRPRGSNRKHGTSQCANMSAIMTNTLANIIQMHHFILTKYRGEMKPPSPILCHLGGPTIIVHIISSSLNTVGKWSHHRPSFANLEVQWSQSIIQIVSSSLNTEGKQNHHIPSSANLEGQRCLMKLQTSKISLSESDIIHDPEHLPKDLELSLNQWLRKHVHNLLIHGKKLQLHSMPLNHISYIMVLHLHVLSLIMMN